MDELTIEKQYQLYLERMGLQPEERMHPEQRKQLKEAFYGATMQMLILFREKIGALDEEEALKVMKRLLQEALDFWKESIEKYQSLNK